MIDGMDSLCYDVEGSSCVMILLRLCLPFFIFHSRLGGGLPLGAKSKVSVVL